MRSTIRARVHRSAAVAAVWSVSLTGLVGVSLPADATTGVVAYSCDTTLTDPFVLQVEIDSTAPDRTYAGEPFSVVATTRLPGELARTAYDDLGARSFSGTLAHEVTVGDTASTLTHAIPETVIPDQATPTPVPFAATAPLSLAVPGDVVLRAGDFDATLVFEDGAGRPTSSPSLAVTCTAPDGPVIDTVVVAARSTTVLTLGRTTSSYGEAITASATVTTTGGAPAGDVAFVVDGVARKARVTTDGTASLDIANAKVGARTVSATFVPSDPTHYDTSTSGPTTWTVGRAASRIAPTITGTRTSRLTKVAVQVRGTFGTEATGKVRIRVVRLGTRKAWARVRTLSGGRASAGFGRLVKGRYKVTITYRGDTGHLRARKVRAFRVKRG